MATRKKILLVDDSPTVLLMERILLQDGPYELLSATTGEEAVKAALAERPDAIIMDVMMPGMNGYEVCRRLRAEEATRTTPIILVTTRSSLESLERGYASGCNDYIVKPFEAMELRMKVASFVGT
ncbi:response regulator [Hyalangium sp.]|uniref:response regulator n=1 Tax=Hyalangium sp. TaxID=2028555 RepID=UPI002D4B894A|nr:response regulator [Hyalangium sp.]HYH97913.1 response regulator [Hyalangium sp.]